MARGGYRPGAGRPKGLRAPSEVKTVPADVRAAANRARLTPLDYMLTVLSDDGADDARRDRMAIAAAPYCHPRRDAEASGKKEQAATDAKSAGQDSEWGNDLAFARAAPH